MKDLVKNILKEQSQMRVVLNGGSHVLDDATIPFQIGFDKSIADHNPKYILVIDVTKDPFHETRTLRISQDRNAERTIFKLEPIHYLQLKKPGIHHLIFVLYKDINKREYQWLLEKSYGGYNNSLYFGQIEEIGLDNQLCYAEVVVDVPEIFFAPEPKSKFQKAIWAWANSWYRLEPVDQCEYRKRKIIAFTIKPILWILGLIPRIVCSAFYTVANLALRIILFFFGLQPVSLFPRIKEVWLDFLLLYPNEGYSDVFGKENWAGDEHENPTDEINYYLFKVLAIGKKRIHLPITLSGLVFYPFVLWVYVNIHYGLFDESHLSSGGQGAPFYYFLLIFAMMAIASLFFAWVTLPTIKNNEGWKQKWDDEKREGRRRMIRIGLWIFFISIGISILSFLITQIPWFDIWSSIKKLFAVAGIFMLIIAVGFLLYAIVKPFYQNIKLQIKVRMAKRRAAHKIVTKEERHQQWLNESFDIKKMPAKVDFKTAPAPSTVVHRFTINFWRVKAKVCKPYAK